MTLKECWDISGNRGNEDVRRFMRDMQRAGLKSKMRYYEGRNFWAGPAVVVDDIQEALAHTKVKCQWDNLGMGWVVYPVVSLRPKSEGK